MMKALAITIVAALALAACAAPGPSAPSGPVNVQIVIAPGETIDIAAARIRVRFQGVLGDSRCPGDAICIQGGDAIVRIDVTPAGGGGVATFDLHTANSQPARIGTLVIALENLSPYPFGSLPPIGPGDYRATLRISLG